jgi:hypothetical protein
VRGIIFWPGQPGLARLQVGQGQGPTSSLHIRLALLADGTAVLTILLSVIILIMTISRRVRTGALPSRYFFYGTI